MKIPLRYQNTEYDCGTTSFVNALAYLYDREEIPVELLKAIYRLSLDVKDDGVTGQGGTSSRHAELIAKYFVDFAEQNDGLSTKCEILHGDDANDRKIRKALDDGGVAIARCFHQKDEHYVLITKISDDFVYLFDPYYMDKNAYDNDEDVAMVFHEEFTHNRIVKLARVFDESEKDYSLVNGDKRVVIILKK